MVAAQSALEVSSAPPRCHLGRDVCDIQGTTSEGIHLGAMAGTVDLIQRCYAGIETRSDRLWLNPYLPGDMKEVKFDVLYRHQWVSIWITCERLTLSARPSVAAPIQVGFRDQLFDLQPGEKREFELRRD